MPRTTSRLAGPDRREVGEITGLLSDLRGGDPSALDRLMPHVYEEMRRIAHRQLNGGQTGHTLSTTGLVHESYMKLFDPGPVPCADRVHFFRVAARAMRQVIIDHARARATVKRGGGWMRVPLGDAVAAADGQAEMLLALDEALTRLAVLDERLVKVVELRFFVGMSEEDAAAALNISSRTLRRDWTKARLWLYGELMDERAI